MRYVDDILPVFENKQDSLNFLDFLNNSHPNIKFTIEKQINHSIALLDVFISGVSNQNLSLQTYYKSTYTELLLNFKSFTSFPYKISLIKCLIDRSFKICNNWNSFPNDIGNIKSKNIENINSLLPHLITTHLVSHLSLSSIFIIISTLIISIFYCLDYTSLLFHLFRTNLVEHTSYNNYIINICPRQLL